MDGDTKENIYKTLLPFTQQVGVSYELVTEITKMFQDKAPSGLKYSVIRTYTTRLQRPIAIGTIPLKVHRERY